MKRRVLDRTSQPGRAHKLSVIVLSGALVAGSVARFFATDTGRPAWQWLGILAFAWLLAIFALRRSAPDETTLRRRLRAALAVLFMVAAAGGLFYGPQPGRELQAAMAIIVGVIAFFGARWVPVTSADVAALGGPPQSAVATQDWSAALFLGISVICSAAAVLLYLSYHAAGFVLWLCSLASFAVAIWLKSGPMTPLSPHAQAWHRSGGPPLSRRGEIVSVVLILTLAVALRTIQLDAFPVQINKDEGNHGRYAQGLCDSGFPDMFSHTWNAFPNMSFVATYFLVPVLGEHYTSLRAAAAFWGVLSLFPLYFFARRWWGNVVGLLALLLLAINREHILWSRWGYNNIQNALVAALMLASWARALHRRRMVDWVWLGYATGLCFYTYHSAKLLPAIFAGIGLLLYVAIPAWRRVAWRPLLVSTAALVLFIAPIAHATYRQWGSVWSGTSNRIDVPRLAAAYSAGNMDGVRSYLRLHVYSTLSLFYFRPWREELMQGPELQVLFLVAAGWLLWTWRDPRHMVLLAVTGGILVGAGMITSVPNTPRLLGMLPTVCLVPALLLGAMRAQIWKAWPRAGDAIAAPLLLIVLSAALYQNWYSEFVWRPSQERTQAASELVRIVDRTTPPATLYMAGTEDSGFTLPSAVTLGMLPRLPERVLHQLADDALIVPLSPAQIGSATLVVAHSQNDLVDLVRHYYPQAMHTPLYESGGTSVLDTFALSPRQVDAVRGLQLIYGRDSKTHVADDASDRLFVPENEESPIDVRGRGVLWIAPPGLYSFDAPGGTLRIDDVPVARDDRVHLCAGWHLLELSAPTLHADQSISPQWLRPDATAWQAIPQRFLAPHPEVHGLLGRYFDAVMTDDTAQPSAAIAQYEQLEPALSFDWNPNVDEDAIQPFAARGSTMEWYGSVVIPEGGAQMRLESTSALSVFLDGTRVLAGRGDASIAGLHGSVPIMVRAVRPANDVNHVWRMRLLWRQAGNTWTSFADYQPPPAGRAQLEMPEQDVKPPLPGPSS